MLTEERITSYISTLTKKGGKPAGEDLKRKTRKALERMLVILLESGHDEPDESDYAKYCAYSKYYEEGTAQDIKHIERYFDTIKGVFPKSDIQLCIVHLVRNSLKYVSWKYRKELARDLKDIYHAGTLEGAEAALLRLGEKWNEKSPAIYALWERN